MHHSRIVKFVPGSEICQVCNTYACCPLLKVPADMFLSALGVKTLVRFATLGGQLCPGRRIKGGMVMPRFEQIRGGPDSEPHPELDCEIS